MKANKHDQMAFMRWFKNLMGDLEWGYQTTLSQSTGISEGYISELLNDKKLPGIETQAKIAQHFNEMPDDFIRKGKSLELTVYDSPNSVWQQNFFDGKNATRKGSTNKISAIVSAEKHYPGFSDMISVITTLAKLGKTEAVLSMIDDLRKTVEKAAEGPDHDPE